MTPPEAMQAHRAGENPGGVTKVAQGIKDRLFSAANDSVVKKLGLDRATSNLLGIKEARPNVIDLVATGVDGLETSVDWWANKHEKWAHDRSERATRHQSQLAERMQRPNAQEEARLSAVVSNVALEALGQPHRVGAEYVPGLSTADRFWKNWDAFWMKHDGRISARDGSRAKEYAEDADAIRKLAGFLRDRSRHEERVTKGEDIKTNAGKESAATQAIVDKLREQFTSVTTTGKVEAMNASKDVLGKPVEDVAGQALEVSKAREAISDLPQ